MAGFETWASFAGLPSRSATAGHALTFNPDHPTGAGHIAPKSRQPHTDLPATAVTLDPKKHNTPETVLRAVVSHLPKGWHVTKLPSHIIMYKNDKRTFPNGKLIGKSPGTP